MTYEFPYQRSLIFCDEPAAAKGGKVQAALLLQQSPERNPNGSWIEPGDSPREVNREEAAELLKNLTVADDGTIHHVLKRYRIVFQESSRLLAPRIAVRNSDCLLLLRAVHCCWKLFGRGTECFEIGSSNPKLFVYGKPPMTKG
uniref:Uncharacterized protein n=1 Tax=Caenorhabditis japonica TaxID=281687 RepID=A0A8R1IB28_CAEJA